MKENATRLTEEIIVFIFWFRKFLAVFEDEIVLGVLVDFVKTSFVISRNDDDDLELVLKFGKPVAEGVVFLNSSSICPITTVDEN